MMQTNFRNNRIFMSFNKKVKLPKQWRHWCADQNMRVYSKRGSAQHQWLYLRGRGYVWRVNRHGMFQRGDDLVRFDRWALCVINEVPVPRTRADFRLAVAQLLAKTSKVS